MSYPCHLGAPELLVSGLNNASAMYSDILALLGRRTASLLKMKHVKLKL